MRMLRTMIVTGAAAALAAGALTMTAATTATTVASGRSAPTAYRAPSAHFLAQARVALLHYLRHNHPTMMLAPHSTLGTSVKAPKRIRTFNWSGYARTSSNPQAFSAVSARWTQPRVKCGIEDQMSSTWVGLDGVATANVEQDGTTAWCYRGHATYFTWFEMFPNGSVTVGRSLKPGDKITASVTRSGHSYRLTVKDATHRAASFSRSKTCALNTCTDQSIEWIQERPAFESTGLIPLADYGSWKATALSGKSKGSTSALEITMIDSTNTYPLSTPSGLSRGSFTTKWHNSY
jgi:Peptidase A4 family